MEADGGNYLIASQRTFIEYNKVTVLCNGKIQQSRQNRLKRPNGTFWAAVIDWTWAPNYGQPGLVSENYSVKHILNIPTFKK